MFKHGNMTLVTFVLDELNFPVARIIFTVQVHEQIEKYVMHQEERKCIPY